MIRFENVTKKYPVLGGRKVILDNASFVLPRGSSLGILGINGAGKSTMIRLIAGTEKPNSGRILRDDVKVSWPLGFAGSFHGNLTGRENMRFAARIYGCDVDQVTAFVEDFSELGDHLDMPIRTYSSGMKARLAFGLSMAIDFDVYLIDEITAVGDARFKKRCRNVFDSRRGISDVIMVSHSVNTLKRYCEKGCVLANGELKMYDDIALAINAYKKMIADMS